MIKNKLRVILADMEMTQTELIEKLVVKRGKFSRTSLVRFMDETKPTINVPLLNDICEILEVQPGDVLKYEPDEE